MDLTIWSRGGISPFYNFSKLSPTFDRRSFDWCKLVFRSETRVVTLGNGVPSQSLPLSNGSFCGHAEAEILGKMGRGVGTPKTPSFSRQTF